MCGVKLQQTLTYSEPTLMIYNWKWTVSIEAYLENKKQLLTTVEPTGGSTFTLCMILKTQQALYVWWEE